MELLRLGEHIAHLQDIVTNDDALLPSQNIESTHDYCGCFFKFLCRLNLLEEGAPKS